MEEKMSKSKKNGISNFQLDPVLPGVGEQNREHQETSDPLPKSKKSSCACSGGTGQCKNCKCGINHRRFPSKDRIHQ